MIKLTYFDFNFWRVDILRLSFSFSDIPYELEKISRENWRFKKKDFPFGQLPVMTIDKKVFCHTHSIARYCAKKSFLYDKEDMKILVIDQVLDWANEITNLIAPSIRAAIREKDINKSKKLRKEFIENNLHKWFSYLENLFVNSSVNKKFFTDKFSIADITAWRVIYWFSSGKLDMIDDSFLKDLPLLKKYYDNIHTYEPFVRLKIFKEIVQS